MHRTLFVLAIGVTGCSQTPTNVTPDAGAPGADMSSSTADMVGSLAKNCDGTDVAADGADDPFYPMQWHLKNTAAGGADLNIGTTWSTNRGKGVWVTVVDDGLEILHEDLAVNVPPQSGLNFWTGVAGFSANATDPTPRNPPSAGEMPAHGTGVGGLVAARDLNGLGVRGVAPRACLVGVNLIANGGTTPMQEGDAMKHMMSSVSVSNNSWGATDDIGTTSTGSQEWQDGIAAGLAGGRSGRGIIYMWAAGNGAESKSGAAAGLETDNSNLDGQANNPGVMAIAALNDLGKRVSYSERGANLWVSGFAETTTFGTDKHGTTTTDISGTQGYNARAKAAGTGVVGTGTMTDYDNGDYTRGFNGTSAATPTVAGVVALVLAANPMLGWRDVRLILAESASQNDAGNTEWQTNKGVRVKSNGMSGYLINQNYGFGVANAAAAVALAKTWTNVGPRVTTYDSAVKNVGKNFADNDVAGANDMIQVTGSAIERIEDITVTLAATGDIGDLDVRLVGSLGTESILAEPHECYATKESQTPLATCGQTFTGWRFSTMRHLGESANQTWTLKVSDRRTGRSTGGTITSWQLMINGRAS